MASRVSPLESAHDTAVDRIAQRHQNDGWRVQADVPGYTNPDTIAGRIPDIVATKRGSRRIIEVETDRSDDQKQHEKFRRHTGQKANTKFMGYVVDRAGRRRERFD